MTVVLMRMSVSHSHKEHLADESIRREACRIFGGRVAGGTCECVDVDRAGVLTSFTLVVTYSGAAPSGGAIYKSLSKCFEEANGKQWKFMGRDCWISSMTRPAGEGGTGWFGKFWRAFSL